jgi:putative salt-induced outer membrane protein YdiY
MSSRRRHLLPAAVLVLSGLGPAALAQSATVPGKPEYKEAPGLYSSTDLSLLFQRGNAETFTAGLNTRLVRQWKSAAWTTVGSLVRADVYDPARFVVADQVPAAGATDLDTERGQRQTKSNRAFLMTDYQRLVSDRVFWLAGASFERDPIAGVSGRFVGLIGLGYLGAGAEGRRTMRFGLGATATRQDNLLGPDRSFFGLRGTAAFEQKLGAASNTVLASQALADENLQDTEDLRVQWVTSLTVSMSRRLALKLNYGLSFDNQPSLVDLPLLLRRPGGLLEQGAVRVPARKTDSSATVSLVVSFAPPAPAK